MYNNPFVIVVERYDAILLSRQRSKYCNVRHSEERMNFYIFWCVDFAFIQHDQALCWSIMTIEDNKLY